MTYGPWNCIPQRGEMACPREQKPGLLYVVQRSGSYTQDSHWAQNLPLLLEVWCFQGLLPGMTEMVAGRCQWLGPLGRQIQGRG